MEQIIVEYQVGMLGSNSTAVPKQPAQADAAELFYQRMNEGQPGGVSTERVELGGVASVGLEGAGRTVGDKVLGGLQSMKTGYESQANAIQESLKTSDPLKLNDMMKLQLDLAKLTLQGELISKTVSKSNQNLDTLLKSQ